MNNISNVDILNIELNISSQSELLEVENGHFIIDYLASGENEPISGVLLETVTGYLSEEDINISIAVESVVCSFMDSYSLICTEMEIELTDYEFYDENNNIPEPGETIYLDYEISNTGEI